MSKNHRNRSWRSQWTINKESNFAEHKSGVVARVCESPTELTVRLENTGSLDPLRWDISKISEQATKLWSEGSL